jgi:hypothetical protein
MSSPRPELLVAPCSYQAAKYAVEKWHYSHSLPAAPVKFGVWEGGVFMGAVLFARGAAMNIGKPYGLAQTEIVELVRVALSGSQIAATSEIVAAAIRLLKKELPGIRLLVSYADTAQGHNGIIYQAMNWVYVGDSFGKLQEINGETKHPKTVYSRYGRQDIEWLRSHVDPNAKWIDCPPKRKYLYPLDRAMRKQIAPLAQPYPKRDTRPVNGDTLATSEAGRFDSEPGALIEAEPHGD